MNGIYLWPSTIGCFLLTYSAHSTILIMVVSTLICWTKPTRPQLRELLWRVALCGGVVTSVIQTVAPLPHWGVQLTMAMHEFEEGKEESANAATDIRTHDRLSLESTPMREQSVPAGGVTGPVRKPIETATASSEPRGVIHGTWGLAAAKLLVWLCLAGCVCVLYALVRQQMALRRLVANGRQVTGGPLRQFVHELGPRLGINRHVQLFSTPLVGVPMATGVRRPRIFLPVDFLQQLDMEQVEALLAHELAHLARRDPLWNLIGFLTCRVFFFQPLNFYARRQLSNESEFVADQYAASVLADRLGLARCLSTLGQWLSKDCRWQVIASYAVGPRSFRSLLGQRVERILHKAPNGHWPRCNRAVWRTAIVSMVLAVLLIGPRASGVAPAVPSHQEGASMNAVTARAVIGSLAVSFGLSAVQADDENPQRLTERDVVKQQIEVFRIALKGLLEADKEDAADVLQRAIRAREVMLEGRRDDEAHEIRERAPNRELLTKVLAMAAEVWREFDNEERATAVGRVAKELGERGEGRKRGREPTERGPRERTERPTEREIVMRWIEVMKIALPSLREGERGDAVELLERAIRAYEVGLEGRKDEEAREIRERMPSQGQIAEILSMGSRLWLEFDNEEKAAAVGRLAKEFAEREANRKRGREQTERGPRERTERPKERDIVMRWIAVMKIAMPALREAERGEAVELLELAIRGYEVTLEGRRDEEAQKIRQRMPSRGQTAEILTMASRLWLEFDNEEKAAVVGRVAKELAPRPREREQRRENAERKQRERTERPTEREIALRRIEVMKLALPALREGERGDAVELLERAIRAYEVGLEGRRDEEAQKIRERMPKRGQLAEILSMASNLWREFNNQDKAEIVGKLAQEVARENRDSRERSEKPQAVLGFNGEVRGVVLEEGHENTITFKVARVVRVWPNANKAENPEALVGRTIAIGPANDLHARFLSKLSARHEVTLEIRGGERNRFVITELTQEQRNSATAD